MKTLYTLLCLFTFTTFAHQTHLTDVLLLTIEKLAKYDVEPEQSFRITAAPGAAVTLNAEDLIKLKGQKIHHVDLIYTAYTGKKTYNQNAVNKKQIEALQAVLPQVKEDDPTWRCIEQTGAKNNKEAKSYFHGFVIHYGPALDYQHLKQFFKPFQTPPKSFTVNAADGGQFYCGDGTTLKINGNAVTTADGSPVEGTYTLQYKEFKNPADILFSGIPMTYNYGKRKLNFSSVGMYDVRAQQDGQDLKLSGNAELDFSCTQQESGVAFYQMDDATGQWTKKKDVAFQAPLKLLSKFNSVITFEGMEFGLNADIYNHFSRIQFDESCWEWVLTHFATHPELNKVLEKVDEENRTAQTTIEPKKFMEMVAEIMMAEKQEEMRREMEKRIAEAEERQREWEEQERKRIAEEQAKLEKMRQENERFGNTLLSENYDEGHTYPAIVKGLNSPDFGVYNCDQVYQLQQPLVLSPTYLDEQGNEIVNKHVVCVMDLNYNGSFSFHPNNITCSGKGKNVILLFTDNKDVYLLSESQFNQLELESNQRPVFQMKNVSSEIKTSDDLKTYLKL